MAATTVGDVLLLHGYGDTFKNHIPLFREWHQIGVKVIAFDFPSHGKSYGAAWDDLDWYSSQKLAEITSFVRNVTLEDIFRPLFISGWSTGGLLAIRIAQSNKMKAHFSTLRGLVVYAPGVSVRKCVGNFLCHITLPITLLPTWIMGQLSLVASMFEHFPLNLSTL